MHANNTVTFGVFPTRSNVESAVNKLKVAGFPNTDISVLFPHDENAVEFAAENETKAPDGAMTGANAGVVVGGALGWLASIGILVIPGVGSFIAAGPIMAAVAGAGGVGGALIGMGISEYVAKRYEGRVKKGGILLSVHCSSSVRVDTAEGILKDSGAEDVSSFGEFRSERETESYSLSKG